MSRAKVILLAVGLDLLAGEPAERWHPVAWMGRLVARVERVAPKAGSSRQLAYGATAGAACLAAAILPALAAERLLRGGGWIGLILTAALLKPAFAVRALFAHVRNVAQPLGRGELGEARSALGRIVSRDVSALDESLVAAGAVESLAENASDSAVAPLFYYALLGLPGAYAYRMANTLDAMWGYRGSYEYLGKAAARLDDLLNLVPARLTALAITANARATGCSPANVLCVAVRDASATASPNAGWPMAAAAGALGVRLEKVGHYELNSEGRPPQAADIGRADLLLARALTLAFLCVAALARSRDR